ncbi:hypothetical protein AVEN_35719-1 [Araneus ventricosus]|uniref:Uncharacterized protein n=1 Tax=Araneus ventricosus TaxID=182803 RepID=A0A4Y2PFW5_ARAVE|nr:hypothetical protein AVEN_35719-1 [Araneus ventricosus]
MVSVGRLGRNCEYERIHFDHESYEQPPPTSTFSSEDRISHEGQGPYNRTPTEPIQIQAEFLALKAAIEWANTANEETNIWSDSESELQVLKSFYVKSKIIQEEQMSLQGNARIRFGWVKVQIDIKGKEIANSLAKEATTDGMPASLSFRKN